MKSSNIVVTEKDLVMIVHWFLFTFSITWLCLIGTFSNLYNMKNIEIDKAVKRRASLYGYIGLAIAIGGALLFKLIGYY